MRRTGNCTSKKWRFAVVVLLFQVSVALGLNHSIGGLFQYRAGWPYQNRFRPVVVLNSPHAEIPHVQNSDIECLGDFDIDTSSPSHGLFLTRPLKEPKNRSRVDNVSGRCLYGNAVQLLQGNPPQNAVRSFGTMFHVGIASHFHSEITNGPTYCASYDEVNISATLEGLAFMMTSDSAAQGEGGGYLGWLNSATNGNKSGHNFAVELDFFQNAEFKDPVGVHVGVNVNDMNSRTTGLVKQINNWFHLPQYPPYFVRVTVWIEYNASTEILEVYISDLFSDSKPTAPLIFTSVNLTNVFNSQHGMFVGFSGSLANLTVSSPGTVCENRVQGVGYNIWEWTFNGDGPAPDVPRDSAGNPIYGESRMNRSSGKGRQLIAPITVPSSVVFLVLMCVILALRRRNSRLTALAKRYQVDLKELEHLDGGPQNFKYKELKLATKGFNPNGLLGSGAFGSVYRGKMRLPRSAKHVDVAVKRFSKTSDQGPQEFVAEVKIIGQAQHRNLVRLIGWCHEKGELLLVYDFMPNGSVDQHLFVKKNKGDGSGEPVLTWARRLKIVSGVATALAFLHEEWEQRVIHRDVKSSNVMLDGDFNARLGDFGLARLSDHGQGPCSSAVLAGTPGYMAPELNHTLKATEKTDVFSFGAVVLEVATGRRPVLSTKDQGTLAQPFLVDWVWGLYRDGKILEGADRRLQSAYDLGEMITLLKIGLLCSHPNPDERPTMRQFLNIWKGSIPFPPLPRSKPVPIYPQHGASLEFDIIDDPDQPGMAMEDYYYSSSLSNFPTETDDDADTTYMFGPMEDYSHSAVEIRQSRGKTSVLSRRAWKSTPLPV